MNLQLKLPVGFYIPQMTLRESQVQAEEKEMLPVQWVEFFVLH